MDVPGRWAGGFRAWDDNGIYLATGRGATPGRVLRLDAPRLRELVNHWFPLAGHLIGGLHRTARSIESTVRQRDALVTLGTLAAGLAHEINNPAAAASRTVDDAGPALRRPARRAHPARPRRHHRRPSSARSTSCAAAPTAPRARSTRWRSPTARASWPAGSNEHGVADPWDAGRARSPPAGIDVAWCERAHERPRRRRARAGSGVGLGDDVVQDPARRAEGRRPPDLRPRRRRSAPTPRWTARPPSASTSATGSRAR